MSEIVDCVVIGAGVVGLAVARACAQAGWDTVVLEAEDAIGTGVSSRNSEVIHSGIYYPAGSLKARLCVRGRELLYAYCARHAVAHARCGKLVVATRAGQEEQLRALQQHALANGVDNLQWLDGAAAQAREPALRCTAALWSPSTGIVDSHGYMLALQGDLESSGGAVALQSPFLLGQVLPGAEGGVAMQVGGTVSMELLARRVVNAAGLQAAVVAARIGGYPEDLVPSYRFAKGNYFALAGRAPFSHLIYPLPEPGGLGVHLTLDLGGNARFGPDVEWVDHIDYAVNGASAAKFYGAIRRYWPDLPAGALHPDYCGIRPKIVGPGEADADFVIEGEDVHGVAGLVNLYGIESPGLTSALAIAEVVCAKLQRARGVRTEVRRSR